MSESNQEVTVDHKTVYPPSHDVIARARVQDWAALSKAAGDKTPSLSAATQSPVPA